MTPCVPREPPPAHARHSNTKTHDQRWPAETLSRTRKSCQPALGSCAPAPCTCKVCRVPIDATAMQGEMVCEPEGPASQGTWMKAEPLTTIATSWPHPKHPPPPPQHFGTPTRRPTRISVVGALRPHAVGHKHSFGAMCFWHRLHLFKWPPDTPRANKAATMHATCRRAQSSAPAGIRATRRLPAPQSARQDIQREQPRSA